MRDVVVLEDPTEKTMTVPAPPVVRFAEINAAAVIVAPQLLDTDPPDMAPFARQAGLRPGESAVVVLRVEVLPDGHVGQVEVDVSSGSRQMDEAAMAYVNRPDFPGGFNLTEVEHVGTALWTARWIGPRIFKPVLQPAQPPRSLRARSECMSCRPSAIT
jgi:TonB family protein